jgi:tetratricopeptide (TPR) repeat protein
MSKCLAPFGFLVLFMSALLAKSPDPQAMNGKRTYAGRWEIQLEPLEEPPEPIAIIEIKPGPSGLSGKLIDVVYRYGGGNQKLAEISEKEGQLTFVLNLTLMRRASWNPTFHGKRVGNHLEGTVYGKAPGYDGWTAHSTTKNNFEEHEDRKALDDALTDMIMTPGLPTESIKQFLRNFPDSSLKDEANYHLAMSAKGPAAFRKFLQDFPNSSWRERASFFIATSVSYNDPSKRMAAMRQFLRDFPNGFLKERANLQLAQENPDPTERTAALRKFLQDFPSSKIKDEAESQLILEILDPGERQAAQEKFIKDYPNSFRAGEISRKLLEAQLEKHPINEAKVSKIIDGYVNWNIHSNPIQPGESFDSIHNSISMSMRATVLNTIADRLMVHEVLLDTALELIQKAVAVSKNSGSRAIYQTTLGQVYFKREEYDQAEKELKIAIEMAGKEGDGAAQLYLGKVYEARNNNDAALETYLAAAALAFNADIKSSLERAYRKKNGSLDGLKEKLDQLNLARSKPIGPGY